MQPLPNKQFSDYICFISGLVTPIITLKSHFAWCNNISRDKFIFNFNVIELISKVLLLN
jgi:hypothetical protein